MDEGAARSVSLRRSVAATLLVLMSGCATVTTQREVAPKSWADLKGGENNVGFRTAGQVNVWYPASSGGEPLRFRDYADALDELEASLHAKNLSDQRIVDLFNTRMSARRDAVAAAGRSPVVMIVMKDGESAADYAVVAEFLASHGHVVAVAPPRVNVDAIRPTLFLHDIDVNTWTFLSSPAEAKTRAEKLLNFIDAHP